ncbi:MAG: hypothetical protein NTX96_00130, partial [Candidatus Zambryskibacteria bacterium]|nr:hypothetical protein [Candidatus Zambryskibacteria bacterium]
LSVAYPAPMYKAPQFLNLGAYCPHAEDISSRMITLFTDTNIPKILVPKIKIAFKKVLNRYLYEKN